MNTILETINSPADLKSLSNGQLLQLAQEIRERLIQSVAKTGGHIGPNLGVVELTIAMHVVFDTPVDSLIFDVSHQAYVHKLLTGREKKFHTIRQPGGLNGFMLRTESEHDSYGAGHAGTALSAALGMAVGRDMAGGSEHIVALAGDAAFTNGISFEALNNIAVANEAADYCAERQRVVDRQECGGDCGVLPQDCDELDLQHACTTRRRDWWRSSAARRRGMWRARPRKRPRGWWAGA